MTYRRRASATDNSAVIEQLERERDEWKQAIDNELVTSLQCTADSYDNPRRALNDLIQWSVDVATDPRCNGGYELRPAQSAEVEPLGFHHALKLTNSVIDAYCEDNPKWHWKIADTPIPNDLAVRMAKVFAGFYTTPESQEDAT